MRERAALILPFAVAAALPVAGLVLALARLLERDYYEAGLMLACALVGSLFFALAFGVL